MLKTAYYVRLQFVVEFLPLTEAKNITHIGFGRCFTYSKSERERVCWLGFHISCTVFKIA